ncbi:MAG: RNA polymerase sigma factor [Clostridia bacterium]|nr:RNA polymerase sigma factor [Clostridia bacterium]
MKNYKEHRDSILVDMTLLEDERAFEELVKRHEKNVKGTAYKTTGNTFSAEDAAQDAFVSAWLNLDSLSDRDKFGSWVCSIAKNHARNLVRKYKNAAADISLTLLEEVDLTGSDESGLYELLSSASIGEAERDSRLHKALDALSGKIRETINLHYFEGLSIAEIAQRLSLPAGTVKWRLCEGRRQLRKEYGIMEKDYTEHEDIVARVMRQVEELKLWAIKGNKEGFEKDYEAVLKNVTALADSKEKSHALADVLLRGYWWLPGKKNDEILAEIKENAINGHNDDVMQSIVYAEYEKKKGEERIAFMRDEQIPWLEENGFTKALGYAWYWLGYYIQSENKKDLPKTIEATRKVLDILKPEDVYYACALSALKVYSMNLTPGHRSARGEVYKYIDGKLYLWEQPGFSNGTFNIDEAIFYYASRCENLLFDADLKEGDSIISSKGKKLTCTAVGATVTTPAGVFENCTVYTLDCNLWDADQVVTAYCEGIGIVSQKIYLKGNMVEWYLTNYKIEGGEGIVPFAPGNCWEYDCATTGCIVPVVEVKYEVTSFDGVSAVTSAYSVIKEFNFTDTWAGNMAKAKYRYNDHNENGDGHLRPGAVEALERAVSLASTKREKIEAEIALDVMKRIMDGDSDKLPDEIGIWNFFEYERMLPSGSKMNFAKETNRDHSFEWKHSIDWDEFPVLYNFLYDILEDATGALWNDEWVDGFSEERDVKYYGSHNTHLTLSVTEEDCTIGLGTFKNCRHVSFYLKGLKGGAGYRGGQKDYWFAPGIGIVKFVGLYKKKTLSSTWELTEYRGEGAKDEYFPSADGLFRRYAPIDLADTLRASVEYTWCADGEDMFVFRNALGMMTKEAYIKKQEKEAEKEKAKN